MNRLDLAGRYEAFTLAVAETMASIVDLHPEAATRERDLRQNFGLRFQPPVAGDSMPPEESSPD